MSEAYIPEIQPCSSCQGHDQKLESYLPEGRRQEVWRVVCSCGTALTQWAVSPGSAVRLWNRYLGEEEKD